MVSITQLAHEIVRSVLQPGEFAIDATAGNGHDTLFLARQVGPAGKVWAIDIQPQAIASTQDRLSKEACHQVQLIQGNHAELETLVPVEVIGRIGAVMFNLGYLPYGDHRLTTRLESTLIAVRASLQSLRSGGVLSIMTYRGHPGGEEEASAVEDCLDLLDAQAFGHFRFPQDRPTRGPQLLAVKKF